MTPHAARFGVLASTGGAVLGALLESPWFRARLAVVAVDRPCGALDRASAARLPVALCSSEDAVARETLLADAFERHGVEHVFVFYTRLLRHGLLQRYRGRLWNLHPSLLPAFPGRRGFADGFAANVPMLGSTLHAIDAGMDTGPVLMQAAFERPATMTFAHARHAVFTQHVRMTLQAARWLDAGRIELPFTRVVLRDPRPAMLHDGVLYAPGLEDREALAFAVPPPTVSEQPR